MYLYEVMSDSLRNSGISINVYTDVTYRTNKVEIDTFIHDKQLAEDILKLLRKKGCLASDNLDGYSLIKELQNEKNNEGER